MKELEFTRAPDDPDDEDDHYFTHKWGRLRVGHAEWLSMGRPSTVAVRALSKGGGIRATHPSGGGTNYYLQPHDIELHLDTDNLPDMDLYVSPCPGPAMRLQSVDAVEAVFVGGPVLALNGDRFRLRVARAAWERTRVIELILKIDARDGGHRILTFDRAGRRWARWSDDVLALEIRDWFKVPASVRVAIYPSNDSPDEDGAA